MNDITVCRGACNAAPDTQIDAEKVIGDPKHPILRSSKEDFKEYWHMNCTPLPYKKGRKPSFNPPVKIVIPESLAGHVILVPKRFKLEDLQNDSNVLISRDEIQDIEWPVCTLKDWMEMMATELSANRSLYFCPRRPTVELSYDLDGPIFRFEYLEQHDVDLPLRSPHYTLDLFNYLKDIDPRGEAFSPDSEPELDESMGWLLGTSSDSGGN